MRKISLASAASAALAMTSAAPAASGPTLSASPNPVSFGQTQTIKGKHWPVIEFCKKRVRLTLHSLQNAYFVGHATIADNGSFVRRWVPKRSKVGAGRWKLTARLRCESGKDGSTNFVKRSVKIRIR
jgi:phosphate-selective porin